MARWQGKIGQPQRWKGLTLRRPGEDRRAVVAGVLAGKISKEQAKYRQAMDEAENKKSCSECQNYEVAGQMNSSCVRVAGIVQADDICDLWVQRIGSGAGPQPEERSANV